MNFRSNEIKIYPAANRKATYDYLANLNTEQNITMLANNILDYKKYIVEGLNLSVQQITENSVTNDYLVISKGKCIINGYNIELGSTNTPSIITEVLDSTNTSPYYIYLKLNTNTVSVAQNATLTQINGYDEDIANGEYTGVSLIIGDNTAQQDEYTLLLGIVIYDTEWKIENEPKNKKIFANNTYIDIKADTNISLTDFNGSFEEWLEKMFIVDDGNISIPAVVETPKIRIKYIDGTILNLDVVELNFGTTLTADMIPSIASIETLYIPDYFTQVQLGALNGASSLVNLTLPFIGASATPNIDPDTPGDLFTLAYIFGTTNFTNSTAITPFSQTYYIPNGLKNLLILNKVGIIAEKAFKDCIHLESIDCSNIIQGTRSDVIGDGAFWNCLSLETIKLPPHTKSIGIGCFQGSTNIKSINIPSSVNTIWGAAFSHCVNLSKLTFEADKLNINFYPSSVWQGRENGPFQMCIDLYYQDDNDPIKYVKANNNNYYIAYLLSTDYLTESTYTINNDTKVLGIGLFKDCTNLSSIILPSSLNVISAYTFKGCSGLTTITLPEDITFLGRGCFSDCTSLTTVISNSIIPPELEPAGVFLNCSLLSHIYVPASAVSAYKSAAGWSTYASIIEANPNN